MSCCICKYIYIYVYAAVYSVCRLFKYRCKLLLFHFITNNLYDFNGAQSKLGFVRISIYIQFTLHRTYKGHTLPAFENFDHQIVITLVLYTCKISNFENYCTDKICYTSCLPHSRCSRLVIYHRLCIFSSSTID